MTVEFTPAEFTGRPPREHALDSTGEGRGVFTLLGQRESSLRALLEDSTDVILLVDRDGTILFASDSVMHIEGCSSSDMLGKSVFAGVHADDLERVRATFWRCAAGQVRRSEAEYRQQHRDGTWRHREATAVNRLAEPGVNAIVVTYRDITDRKRAQQKIDHLFNLSPDMIATFDYAGRFVRLNAVWTQVLGYPAEGSRGRPLYPWCTQRIAMPPKRCSRP